MDQRTSHHARENHKGLKENMINLILLASGYSSRFGENKLLYEIDGMPMYRHMLNSALSFQKDSVESARLILVTAYEAIGEYAVAEAGFSFSGRAAGDPFTNDRRLLVCNRNQAAGISHSIALGIKALLKTRKKCGILLVRKVRND